MRKRNSWLALFLAMGLCTGLAAVPAQSQTEGSTKATTKEAATQAGHKLGNQESISGIISSVDSAASTVTVTSGGIPYVFRLTKNTKIDINGNKGDLEALTKQVNQRISVRFVPRSDGNFAENIEVKSS